MLDYMKKAVKANSDLNIEDRNLLSVAYKNTVGTRRTAWRALSSIEQKEESKGSKFIKLIKDYKQKIEEELTNFCNDILELLDKNLIDKASVIHLISLPFIAAAQPRTFQLPSIPGLHSPRELRSASLLTQLLTRTHADLPRLPCNSRTMMEKCSF